MTAVFKLNGVALPDGAILMGGGNSRLPGGVEGLPASAWFGEPMTAGIVIDDTNGDIDVPMWSTFTVDETDDVGKERIFSGWIRDRRISRGPSYKSGVARQWAIDITDIQALFSFDCFRAKSAQRGEESDIARITFALSARPLVYTPIVDNGRFNTANPINLGPGDYVLQYPVEMFQSITAQCSKNFYAYWDDTAAEISFHYDELGAGPAAGIAISNVIADVDNVTTFFPFVDAEQHRDPDRVYTDEMLTWLGGTVTGLNQATVDALSPTEFSPVEFHRTLVRSTSRIGKLATAEAQVIRDLDFHAEEDVLLSVTLRLPSAVVNECHAGDVITSTFTHIPGHETPTDMVIVRRIVVPVDGRTDMYDVHLELTNQGIERGPGGDPPDEFPVPPCDTDVFLGDVMDPPPFGGFGDMAWFDDDDSTWGGILGSGGLAIWDAGAEVTIGRILIKWSYGTLVPGAGAAAGFEILAANAPWITTPTPTTIVSDSDPVTHAGVVYPSDFEISYPINPPQTFRYWKFHNTTGGNNDVKTLNGFSACEPPPVGQEVIGEHVADGNGTATTFTTAFPYATGSLKVYVDGVQIINGLTESDPTTGEFTLDFAPHGIIGDTRAEIITASYQVGYPT